MNAMKFEMNQNIAREALRQDVGRYNMNIAQFIVSYPNRVSCQFDPYSEKFVVTHFCEDTLNRFGKEVRSLAEKEGLNVNEITMKAAHHYLSVCGVEVLSDNMSLRAISIMTK